MTGSERKKEKDYPSKDYHGSCLDYVNFYASLGNFSSRWWRNGLLIQFWLNKLKSPLIIEFNG